MSKHREEHRVLGRLPTDWTAELLSELALYLQRGMAPTYVEESEVRALNQRAIRWGRIEPDFLKYHDPDVPVPERHVIKVGDVVVNSTGDITIGRAYLFTKKPDPLMFADSHVTIVRTNPERLKPEYLVNLLATPQYQDLVYSMVTGSTGQLELNRTNLAQLPILRPPLPLQQKLVDVWKPLYDSIQTCDALRNECEAAIRLFLERDVLDAWKVARWDAHE